MTKEQIILDDIKQKIESLNAFKNVKIGLEKGITTKDVPFARIVPKRIQFIGTRANLPFIVFIGIKQSKDLEEDYDKVLPLYRQVRKALNFKEIQQGVVSIKDIYFDEDRLENFKMLAVEFTLEKYHAN